MPKRVLIRQRTTPADTGGGLYFSSPKENIKFIPSGAAVLDCVLGGGWALGRIANIVGDRSTGKTLLAMEGIANFFQVYTGDVRYNEAESAFDPDYAKALGIPMDRVEMRNDCATVEEFEADVNDFLKGRKRPGLYILDSLDALSDAAELDRDPEKGSYGAAKAKKLSEFFRKLTQPLKRADVCLMVISQVREAIGVTFGARYKRSGGKALDFYGSQELWLANKGRIKRTVSKVERPVGVTIKAKCEKNKVGMPFRDCEFEITFGYGVEDEKASRAWLTEIGTTKQPADPMELRALVIRRWFEIEKSFLPDRQKYGKQT